LYQLRKQLITLNIKEHSQYHFIHCEICGLSPFHVETTLNQTVLLIQANIFNRYRIFDTGFYDPKYAKSNITGRLKLIFWQRKSQIGVNSFFYRTTSMNAEESKIKSEESIRPDTKSCSNSLDVELDEVC
jgi:hypothetical protein